MFLFLPLQCTYTYRSSFCLYVQCTFTHVEEEDVSDSSLLCPEVEVYMSFAWFLEAFLLFLFNNIFLKKIWVYECFSSVCSLFFFRQRRGRVVRVFLLFVVSALRTKKRCVCEGYSCVYILCFSLQKKMYVRENFLLFVVSTLPTKKRYVCEGYSSVYIPFFSLQR